MRPAEKDELDTKKYPESYRRYLKQEERFIAKSVGTADKVLDVGCGAGRLIPLLAPKVFSYTGIDKDGEYIKQAKKAASHYSNTKILALDAHKISEKFRQNAFDVAVAAWHTIGCVSDDMKVLKELSKVAGKRIIFSVASKGSLETRIKYYNLLGIDYKADKKSETIFSKSWDRVRAYSEQDIRDLCKGLPFSIKEIKPVLGLGYFVVLERNLD